MTELLWLSPKNLENLTVGDIIVYKYARGYAIAQILFGGYLVHFSTGEPPCGSPIVNDSFDWILGHCEEFAIIGNIAILAEMEDKILKKLNLK